MPSLPASSFGLSRRAFMATTVLAYLLPDATPGRFTDLATQAAMADAWSRAASPAISRPELPWDRQWGSGRFSADRPMARR